MDARDVIFCDCGERLVEAIDEDAIVIQGQHHTFRRTTDHVICHHCGQAWSVNSLRAEAAARGDLAPPIEAPAPEDPDDG